MTLDRVRKMAEAAGTQAYLLTTICGIKDMDELSRLPAATLALVEFAEDMQKAWYLSDPKCLEAHDTAMLWPPVFGIWTKIVFVL